MLTQVGYDGFGLTMMEGIIDYQKDMTTAVTKDDMYIITKRGKKKISNTTVGWQLLVQWRDQYESWIYLKYLKESHQIYAAEFAKARGIENEPAFAWWAPYTMQKRDVIPYEIKSRIRKTTHNLGIETPKRIEHGHR